MGRMVHVGPFEIGFRAAWTLRLAAEVLVVVVVAMGISIWIGGPLWFSMVWGGGVGYAVKCWALHRAGLPLPFPKVVTAGSGHEVRSKPAPYRSRHEAAGASRGTERPH